ncbi:ras-like protein [Anaeramoeba ignava]|uniref:small monomeric GTPase n=1 Tax=Anaeramoeba ignava TaxID=1746090 RepID=A0A9Q0R554_ANAIG|nr:ras-like protein [Anaeramoeba ignava]
MSEESCKIVVVGSGSVGKSCLTLRYLQSKFVEDYDPTIEESYRKMVIIDQEPTLLEVLDTAGQDEYRSIRDKYFQTGEGFIIVYSVTSDPSFVEAKNFHQTLQRIKEYCYTPVITVGNKADLENERRITYQQGQELSSSFKSKFMETSAKTGMNVPQCFEELVREIRKWKKKLNQDDTEKVEKPKKKKLCSLI